MALLLLGSLGGGCYGGVGNGPGGAGGGDAGSGGVGGGEEDTSGDAGASADDGPVASCEDPSVGFVGYRRITRSQYDHAIRDLFGFTDEPAGSFTPDEKIGPFTSNSVSPVGALQLEQYMRAAESLAARAVEGEDEISALVGCSVPETAEGWGEQPACIDGFIADFGSRVYRRPLDSEEVERYQSMYDDTTGESSNPRDGVRVVVQALLQSPFFLYHVEQGEPLEGGDGSLVWLTDHEVASRLSFLLWDTIPDDTLRDRALAGELRTPEQIDAEVTRMLADPRARDGIASFHLQWLEVEDIESVEKNGNVFPDFDPALAAAMREETAQFAYRTLTEGDGRLETLLLDNHTYTEDEALLALYGTERPGDHAPGESIALDPSQRAGLLTRASVLASHAHADQTSPVHRGVFVRHNLLCHILPPPPPDVDDTPPDPDPDATTRERFDQHTEDPSCAACHSMIDPIGFGFENYDGIGRFRDEENGAAVDASGELVATADIDGSFDGVLELSERLAGSEQVQQCMARQWFRFAFGRVESDADACSLETIDEDFAASGHHIPSLIGALARSDAFRMRRTDSN